MNLDRNFWAKHLQSNLASKKPKLVNSDLVGAGALGKQITQISPLQGEIKKIETKIIKKRKKRSKSNPRKVKRRKVERKTKTHKKKRTKKRNQLKRKQQRKKKGRKRKK